MSIWKITWDGLCISTYDTRTKKVFNQTLSLIRNASIMAWTLIRYSVKVEMCQIFIDFLSSYQMLNKKNQAILKLDLYESGCGSSFIRIIMIQRINSNVHLRICVWAWLSISLSIYIFLINLRFPINQTLILITSASRMAWTLLRDLVNVEMRQLICVVSRLNLKYERHTNWIWNSDDDWAHHVLWYCFNKIIRMPIWKYILKMDYAYL